MKNIDIAIEEAAADLALESKIYGTKTKDFHVFKGRLHGLRTAKAIMEGK